MELIQSKNAIMRFLKLSFVGVVIFSVFSFTCLGLYMNNKSHEAFHKIGNIYLSGTSEQISKHFESVIQLRFNQVEGLVSVVSSEEWEQEDLYQELAYRANVRGFAYLALCAPDGTMETLSGKPIQPLNPEPFTQALVDGERRVAIGADEDGKQVVLFGVDANYPMPQGGASTGLVAAVPLEYITEFLSLDEEDQMMALCIVRNDGTFVIENDNMCLGDDSQRLPELLSPYPGTQDLTYRMEDFDQALENNQTYGAVVSVGGEEEKLYSVPLSNSEWNLISIMPNNQINDVLDTLNVQRTRFTVLACLSVLTLMILIFARYFQMSNAQIKELEKSRHEAAAASKAKSEFLANMSHDIRTPMNAIVGMTAIATAHIGDLEQVKNCLRKIALSSKQLLGLINDVLDMSKVESGKMTMTAENISLKELFDGIVSIMQPQINAKGQHFEVHVDKVRTENVVCDGVRLNQVLLNLLSNATKYTPEGGRIQLSLWEEVSPKGDNFAQTHIMVTDNGMGMSPEFQEKIFEAYSRADSARTQKIEGTGLGMTITKYIVDAMGGTIQLQSQLGKGSQFHLTFDFEKAPVTEVNMVLPPWNMLVVDDDAFLCESTIEVLKTFGIHAEWTLSGEKAIEMAVERHNRGADYQIVLLDWKLPGMNGIQTARKLREHLHEEVPILLISAYDWSEFEAEAREAGINGFISKPLFKSTLFYNLRKYINKEEAQEESPQQGAEFTGRRILLAEDNELNWEVAKELLSDLGAALEWAEDGKYCLEKFEASPAGFYDLILMDLRMPRMTGYEATAAIRKSAHPDAQKIPIIAMSADAFPEDVQRCLESGMNGHIAKPVDPEALAKQVERYWK